MPPKLYSYLRCSIPEQLRGDSLPRQTRLCCSEKRAQADREDSARDRSTEKNRRDGEKVPCRHRRARLHRIAQ